MGELYTSNRNYPIGYTVQLSMADSLHTARELRDENIDDGYNAHIVVDDNGGEYKCYVRISPPGSKQAAQELLEHLKAELPDDPHVKEAFINSMVDTRSVDVYRDDLIMSICYQESLGSLRIGLPDHEVLKMSCIFQEGEEKVDDATEVGGALEYVQVWSSPACGLSLEMSSVIQGEPKQVRSVTIAHPSLLETERNIRIGSSEQEVRDAYGDYEAVEEQSALEMESADEKAFVAGSIYGGLTFTLQDGKVKKIFLGGLEGC